MPCPPGPPSRCSPGIRLQAAEELVAVQLRLRRLGPGDRAGHTEEPGSALVSGRLLAEISRSLPAKPVHITAEDGRAVLTCGSATFTLLTMPEDEYPALPEMPPAAGTIGSDAFATAVSQSATAAGRDDTLPALTGVRIEIDGETLTLVSTDRYRLAVRELRWNPARPDLTAAMLVPAKALADTARSLTNGAAGVDRAGAAGRRGQRRRRHDRLRGRGPAHHHPAAVRRVPAVPVAAAARR